MLKSRCSFVLLSLTISVLLATVLSDLIISKLDRHIDLTSQIVRITSTLKIENSGSDLVSEVLVVFPEQQVEALAYLAATPSGKSNSKSSVHSRSLPIQAVHPSGRIPSLNFYSVSLPITLSEGHSFSLRILAVFTHRQQPFPKEITQAEAQLVLFEDNLHYLSPYAVGVQSLTVKLPGTRIESYTETDNTRTSGSEIKYGPHRNLPPFSYSPLLVHFESHEPFAFVQELVREIQVPDWGGALQIVENYKILHGGAKIKGEFSRLDYQARPSIYGAAAVGHLIAKLPPRTRSIYYRDEIGNISTSDVRVDSKKTELLIQPRYPLFGGWGTAFTIGYALPVGDFVFESDGKRFLNISFGSPFMELVIDNLIVKVVLPELSANISVFTPFAVKQRQELKISHLDIVGRQVVVLEKSNIVPEHNQYFQVYYKFNKLSMAMKPLMLICGGFLFLLLRSIYMHTDLSISRSSPSYLAKKQFNEARAKIQVINGVIMRCLREHERLETSLRDLSRTGDVQACKQARKTYDASMKGFSDQLKLPLAFLSSSPAASHLLPKVEELVGKEKDVREKMVAQHAAVITCYEKKLGARDVEKRVAQHQTRVMELRQEIKNLLDYLDDV